MSSHITRYDKMPIPPIDSQTEWFEAGPVTVGVEYRLLNEAIAAASALEGASGDAPSAGVAALEDRGVSLHVYGSSDGESLEYLRFDCFMEDPHYHYVNWGERSNEMIHLDPVADGDPLSWALERIRTRLAQMLERAGAGEIAGRLDSGLVDEILPRITEAAYRSRYQHDDDAVLRDALSGSGR